MGNIFNDDFRDFLAALNDQEVRYILVGGFSGIRIIHKNDLIKAKKLAGRSKDMNDLENLH